MKKNKNVEPTLIPPREDFFGVPPTETKLDTYTVHKCAKKGKSSFLITKSLIDKTIQTSKKLGLKPKLIISIPNGTDSYTLTCYVSTKVVTNE